MSKKIEIGISAISVMLMLLLLLSTPLMMFSLNVVAADEANVSDGSSVTTADTQGDDGGQKPTSDASNEGAQVDDTGSGGQATLVDEASTASYGGEDGTTSDGEQAVVGVDGANVANSDEEQIAGVVNDASVADPTENAVVNETSSEGQVVDVVYDSITAGSEEVSDGEQASVSDQTSENIAATYEEDPVKISYNGEVYSSPPGPSFTVCLNEPLTITVVTYWFQPPNPDKVSWASVVMVDKGGYGITFDPSSFTLYNPSYLSQTVLVTVPAFSSIGIYQMQIYADVTAQGPSNTPKVAGTNMYFQVNVVSCEVTRQADLSIAKSGPEYAHVGDEITYTYIVTNAGPDEACNVVVTDNKAGTATYVSGDTDGDGRIDPGEIWQFTATYTVQEGDPDPLVNTATVSSDTEDPNMSNNVATWSVDILHPAIDVSKSGPEYAHEDDTISYTITVKNTGDTPLYDVTVSDDVLGFSWTGVLDVGEEETFTVYYTIPSPSGDVTNTVTASGEDILHLAVTDTASWTVDVLHPAITIDKSADKDTAYAGETITYTIIVTNTGDTPLYDVSVTDTLLGTIWTGTLGVDESVTITTTYTVHAGDPDPLENTATASGRDVLGLTVTATDTWTVDLIAKICGYKFYDANANGLWDAGEPAVAGFKIELYMGDTLYDTAYTGEDGSYCFDNLNAGTYTVKEVLPSGSWIPTTSTSITVTLLSGEVKEDNNFGNLCLEPGHGGKTLGYWANAGNKLITADDVSYLNGLNLYKPTGWIYPPFSSDINTARKQINNYLLSANAKNMWWMLSAQLIATILNVRHGYLDGSTLVCVDPSCSSFKTVNDIINGAISALGPNTPRAEQAYWKNLLDNLNNNRLPFVCSGPCPVEYP
ncbi:MAG: hypothetical protein LZ162_01145 [Thaumarchaeota archaeon]|nr:hypothetical protein [Candidatus Terraquivivens yellowstonensis]